MSKIVGFSLRTRREWLDAALDQVVHKNDETKIRIFLDEYMKEELPGKQYRDKSLGIVQKIWISIPAERIGLREQAVALAPGLNHAERLWLHWGMSAMAYPFFRDAAEVIGRLASLQDTISTAQIHDRLLAKWGDRPTIKDAVQRLTNTLVDWNVLQLTPSKALFTTAEKVSTPNVELQLWLLNALFKSSNADEIELQQLLRLPGSFPFVINVGVSAIRTCDRFNIHRQGLDMDMVALVKQSAPSPEAKKRTKAKNQIQSTEQQSIFDKGVSRENGDHWVSPMQHEVSN